MPLVEVELNGYGPYRFLIDLGSNVMVIRQSIAREAGLQVAVDREGPNIVVADLMEIGDAAYEDVWFGEYEELDVAGVVGFNLLSQAGIVLDYPGRLFRMGPVHLPEPDGAEVISYEVNSRLPYIQAWVGKRPVLLNLDTGAANHIVFPEALIDSLPLVTAPVPGPTVYNNQTGAVRTSIARLNADIRFGNHLIERPVVIFDPDVDDAWLGSAILLESVVEIDPENRSLSLVSASPLASSGYRTLGISLGRAEATSGLRPVVDVIPGTPAAAIPIVLGDSVQSIAGVDAAALDSHARSRLAAEHDSVEVMLKKGGSMIRVQLHVAVLGSRSR